MLVMMTNSLKTISLLIIVRTIKNRPWAEAREAASEREQGKAASLVTVVVKETNESRAALKMRMKNNAVQESCIKTWMKIGRRFSWEAAAAVRLLQREEAAAVLSHGDTPASVPAT